MTVKDRPGLKEIAPGLYVSTDLEHEGALTHEVAESVRRISGSNVLADLIEEAIRRKEQRKTIHKQS